MLSVLSNKTYVIYHMHCYSICRDRQFKSGGDFPNYQTEIFG